MELRNQAIWHVVSSCKVHFFMAEMLAILFLNKAVSLALTMAVEIVVAWVALA